MGNESISEQILGTPLEGTVLNVTFTSVILIHLDAN
jgi:hypothetical protein